MGEELLNFREKLLGQKRESFQEGMGLGNLGRVKGAIGKFLGTRNWNTNSLDF